MTIKREYLAEPCRAIELLPETRPIEVRHPGGTLSSISPLSRDEAEKLIGLGFMVGVLTKHGYLRYLRMVVSVQACRRVLKRSHKHASERIPIAEDNFTVRKVTAPGVVYFELRQEICAAYTV